MLHASPTVQQLIVVHAVQYGQQPSYPSQQAAPPQMPPHQVPYASQPMYPQTAATYPAYPQAAPVPSYYVAPAHAYPQPQMHDTSIQQPQTAAQVAMMAAIKVSYQQLCAGCKGCTCNTGPDSHWKTALKWQ